MSDDLAPRDAPLKFVWPNPKAHLTQQVREKDGHRLRAPTRRRPPSRSSSRSAAGPTTWPTIWQGLRGRHRHGRRAAAAEEGARRRGAAAAAAAAAPPPPVVKEEVAAVVTATEDDKGPTVADLAAYLVSRGGHHVPGRRLERGQEPARGYHLHGPFIWAGLPVEARGGALPERGPRQFGEGGTAFSVRARYQSFRARRSARRGRASCPAGVAAMRRRRTRRVAGVGVRPASRRRGARKQRRPQSVDRARRLGCRAAATRRPAAG